MRKHFLFIPIIFSTFLFSACAASDVKTDADDKSVNMSTETEESTQEETLEDIVITNDEEFDAVLEELRKESEENAEESQKDTAKNQADLEENQNDAEENLEEKDDETKNATGTKNFSIKADGKVITVYYNEKVFKDAGDGQMMLRDLTADKEYILEVAGYPFEFMYTSYSAEELRTEIGEEYGEKITSSGDFMLDGSAVTYDIVENILVEDERGNYYETAIFYEVDNLDTRFFVMLDDITTEELSSDFYKRPEYYLENLLVKYEIEN